MALILMRHAETEGGAGRCYGRLDLAAGPGTAAAAEAALAALPPLARVVTSPLVRARVLAASIAERRGLAPVEDARLAEIDFGSWEGLAWDEVPRAELEAWAADLHGARPHGGESVAMLQARVAEALGHWRGLGGTTLIVSHAGVARAAAAVAGLPNPWGLSLGYGAWIEV